MLGHVQEVSAGRPGVGTGPASRDRPPSSGLQEEGSSTYFKGPPVYNKIELPAYRV